ncbi:MULTISPECIES: hypothetical protein [unclassified Leeuwenhoekiella]|mgnify:CR=1|uniref:hypothetical protein n=1 Tax=unclassified Leeuwenhoekiella TaxID=2615029 RepID=UPI000C4D350C|nr:MULTISPECIES: hypothetical protein [unclassified Leeuwenhoekiella]MAW94805.1 hypothetical protein [Leeuwenhoekiella sp.]MBA79525.1 hypothetical protein [Leeuwenhoekiella sp.]|tara:strand:- start:45151 stop:45510 length:360 start_codon:yes stop_codon:yes gene_type:complete
MNIAKDQETLIVLSLAALIAFLKFELQLLLILAIGFLLIAILSKWLSHQISRLWLGFSFYFGLVMNYIIMFFIYFLILTPLALLQKLFGSNQLLKGKGAHTYFTERNHQHTFDDLKNPW